MQSSRNIANNSANGGLGLYHFVWVGSALVAAGYLAVVAFQPELVARLASASDAMVGATAPSGNAKVDLAQQVDGLTRSIDTVESNIADIRRSAASHRDVTKALSDRVTALEARFDPDDVKVSSATSREGGSPGRADLLAIRPSNAGETPATGAPQAKRVMLSRADERASTTIPKVLNAGTDGSPNGAAIVTGSIAAKVAPPPPEKSTIERRVAAKEAAPAMEADERKYGLEVGRGATLEALRARWAEVSAKNGARLKGLAPYYRLVVDKNGDPLRLIAGPVVGEANAKVLCRDLAVLGTRCRYSGFNGSPL